MTATPQTPFGFGTTADEVLRGVDLAGRRAIVTGGNSGIGLETARSLARAGAHVTIAVRRPEAVDSALADLRQSTGAVVDARPLDLADLSSVRAFCAAWKEPLHILVNNAGIMALPRPEFTPQGWEMQFAVNFLGHFALTTGLQRALFAAGGARVVSVSSSAHLLGPVVFDDLHFRFRPYEPFAAYAQAKCACVLLAVEATRRWQAEGVFANALNPGAIATNLQKHTGGLKTAPERRKTPQQGAATSVVLAASPRVEGIGGRYFEDCNEAETVSSRTAEFTGVAPYALDPGNARRLWDTAEGLLAS